MNNKSDNVLMDKSFLFAIRIVRLYQYLCKEHNEFVLSKQIVRCGTSVGANVEEAHGGISDADFSNKISISYKEARETKYWLRLLNATDYIDKKLFDSMYSDCDELCKLSYSILDTTRISS
ncbi:MAG: four helix bundle protein [Ignavibacteria bacterium]|nr:four helix bundle protein [Ignavibacteria bacterium]